MSASTAGTAINRSTAGTATDTVVVGTGPVTVDDVVAVARHGAGVRLSDEALEAVGHGRAVVGLLAADPQPHYGISTGFGALATLSIPAEKRRDLQRSLVRSHAASTGPQGEREGVRALMLPRLSTLAPGRTGVRHEVAPAYAAMINAGVTP